MGNIISSYSNFQLGGSGDDSSAKEDIIKLTDSLDFIATYYILTMNFQSLRQLHEKKYCEELVILTSDIINKYFNDLEVAQLAQRVDSGSQKLVYFKKADIDSLNIPDSETKKIYCNEIAKFYIKIAHVFAAIVTTINPEYVYKDTFGNVVKKPLIKKDTIPSDVDFTVSKINLCSERIDALKGKGIIDDKMSIPNLEKTATTTATASSIVEEDNGYEHVDKNGDEHGDVDKIEDEDTVEEIVEEEQSGGDSNEQITIHPEICSVNLDRNGETNYLNEEPGINELIELYFDGDYDYKTGKFLGMTPKTEKKFQEDLKRFYSAFTDNHEMPADIKKFGDIKLRDYSKKSFCKTGKSASVQGSYKDELFIKYADNLKTMIQSVNNKQIELLAIINKIFVYVLDPVTKKDVIRINPDLNEEGLQEIVEQTRTLIVELYLKCEEDFVEGVKIYEAIVESQIFDTTQKHIDQLEKEKEKLIAPVASVIPM
jgi:hypothetical protein